MDEGHEGPALGYHPSGVKKEDGGGWKAASCLNYPHTVQKAGQRGHSIPGEGGTEGLAKSEVSNQKEKSSCALGVVGFISGCHWYFCFKPDLCSHQGTFFECKKDFCCLNAQIRYFDDCRTAPISCLLAWWPRPSSRLDLGNRCIFPQKNVVGFVF